MEIFKLLITQPLANGIILFYKILGSNLGLAIIAFSVFLRLALSPLTRPYMESMKKIKKHQPQIAKLRKKYKDDKAKLAQAQADFYKQKGINPFAGCLPYIFQIVILIALFRLFITVLSPQANVTQEFNNLLYPSLQIQQGQEIQTSFLWMDLTQPDTIAVEGVPFALPGLLLFAAALVQFISAKISQPFVEQKKKAAQKTPEKSDDIATSIQSSMIYTFPLMTLLIGLSFPSGLALYWLVFSLYQAVTQYKTSGWGGLTPWLKKAGLLKSSPDVKDKK